MTPTSPDRSRSSTCPPQHNFELYAIDRTGRNERRITSTARLDEEYPRFSRDAKRLVYVVGGGVATATSTGTGSRRLGAGTAADWR